MIASLLARARARLPEGVDRASVLLAVDAFAMAHPEYATPGGAWGECWGATDAFLLALAERTDRGLVGEAVHFVIESDCADEHSPYEDRQGKPRLVRGSRADYPLALVPQPHLCCHRYARVGDLCIDWTARQFDPKAPFPMAWIEEKK